MQEHELVAWMLNSDYKSGYMGEGQYGSAYLVDYNGKEVILKITTSFTEFSIAQNIKAIGKVNALSNIIEVYETFIYGSDYYIVEEFVDICSYVENYFSLAMEAIYNQGCDLLNNYFDTDAYKEFNDGVPYDDELIKFIDELNSVVSGYKYLGIPLPDIHDGNLGRDKNGVLKAFDIDSK